MYYSDTLAIYSVLVYAKKDIHCDTCIDALGTDCMSWLTRIVHVLGKECVLCNKVHVVVWHACAVIGTLGFVNCQMYMCK